MARERSAIDTLKKQTVLALSRGVAVGAERLAEMMESSEARLGEVAVALGIAVDKLQLLRGEVTARVEEVRRVPTHAEVAAYLADLPSAADTDSGRAIKSQQVGGDLVASGGGQDLQSGVSRAKGGGVTAFDTDFEGGSAPAAGDWRGSGWGWGVRGGRGGWLLRGGGVHIY
jgi:hypothetical protein